MKPELVIHIGSPKTGSTSLQWAFAHNKNILNSEAIFYPMTSAIEQYGLKIRSLIDKEALANITGVNNSIAKEAKDKTERSVDEVLASFQKGHYRKMLISAEAFFHDRSLEVMPFFKSNEIASCKVKEYLDEIIRYRAIRLKHLFKKFDIKIVCYLRRQDLYLESLYNQLCKRFVAKEVANIFEFYNDVFEQDNRYDFQIYEENLMFNVFYQSYFSHTYYHNILEIWAGVIKKENIIVKPFEKSQLQKGGGGLIKDFFINVLNIEPSKLNALKEIIINDRINRDLLEYINRLEKRPKYFFSSGFDKINKEFGDVNKYQNYFTLDERIRLLDYHKADNAKIAREYLGRKNGDLFYDKVNEKNMERYPGLTSEKIAILDKEFEQFARRDLICRVKPVFFIAKSEAENIVSTENGGFFITRFKVCFLTISIFLKAIIRKIIMLK